MGENLYQLKFMQKTDNQNTPRASDVKYQGNKTADQ